jgi:hypothetical protein
MSVSGSVAGVKTLGNIVSSNEKAKLVHMEVWHHHAADAERLLTPDMPSA